MKDLRTPLPLTSNLKETHDKDALAVSRLLQLLAFDGLTFPKLLLK